VRGRKEISVKYRTQQKIRRVVAIQWDDTYKSFKKIHLFLHGCCKLEIGEQSPIGGNDLHTKALICGTPGETIRVPKDHWLVEDEDGKLNAYSNQEFMTLFEKENAIN